MMSFAYCSADLGHFLSHFQRLFIDIISKILRGKSQPAKDANIFLKLMGGYTLGTVTKLNELFEGNAKGLI